MAGYVQTRLLGAASPLVDKDKGDFSNRMGCAGAQIKNNVKTLAQDVVVIGGAGASALAIKKSPKLQERVVGFFDKVVKRLMPAKKHDITLIGESGKPFKTFELRRAKLGEKLLNMSKKSKIAAAILVPTSAALSFIGCKHIYKTGQIDQKYTDKAKIEKHQDEVLD